MRGSIFPNGVRVDHSALSFTELSKANEILKNRTSWTSGGIYSGFGVSINAIDSTLINIGIGSGFAPNGEFVETSSDYFSISLDDYTLNAINYVCCVYTEVGTHKQPHESNGSTYSTRSEMSWRIRVYEETNYNALATTDDNLANDAKDRIIILATVTANGTGISLTSNNITGPIDYNNILYAIPSELVSITGVTVTNISSNTGPGSGSLSYTYAVGPVYTFTWTSASGGAGASVVVNADGYWNFLDGAGEYISCYIVLSQLPTTGSFPMSESISITNLYYQAVPRLTGEDTYHRNLVGTGIISPTNPHGTSIDDISGDSIAQLEEHRDIMHCNGIWRDSSTSILTTSIITTSPIADTLNIQVPLASDLFFINGNKLNSVNNSSIPFNPWLTDWGTGMETRTNFFEIYVNDSGDVKAHRKATYPASRNLRGTWIVDISESYPVGSYNLSYVVSGAYTYLTWDNGPTVSLLNADFGVSGNSRVIRLFNAEGIYWVDLWINMDDAKHGSDDDKFNNLSGPLTDSITVLASLDWDSNMQIASLSYWYDVTSPKGKLGYAPYTSTRRNIDKRPFGTLCAENISDKALQNLTYHQQDEMHFSGVLLDRDNPGVEFIVSSTSSLNMTITGGHYYCRGQKLLAIGDVVTLVDNVVNLVWLSVDGTYNVIDVTTDYSGDLQAAMRYILGGPTYTPNIDDDTHNTDTLDPPERGVILFRVVTSGGAILYYEDLMRNVNGPVEPWSVAGRARSSSTDNLSAFDSLNAAFDYASLYNRLSEINIRIIGPTDIRNRIIFQPKGVSVTGGKDECLVTVYHSAWGAWCLSEGCKVSNVSLEAGVNSISVFGIGAVSASAPNANNIIIEGCKFDCGSYTTDSVFIRMSENGIAGSDISNIIIKDNAVIVGYQFVVYQSFISISNFSNIHIYDNEATVLDNRYAIFLTSSIVGRDIFISNNSLTCNLGINLKNTIGCKVSNNTLTLGDSGGNTVVGINLEDMTDIVVSENSMLERSGNTSTDMTGVITDNLNNLHIVNNVIRGMNNGINDTRSNVSSRLIISGNIIDVDSASGVSDDGIGIYSNADDVIVSNNYVSAESVGIGCGPNNTVSNIKIIGNIVEFTTINSALTCCGIGSTGSIGIIVGESINNVSIENNHVYMIGNAGVIRDQSMGIYVINTLNCSIRNCNTRASATSVGGTGSSNHIGISGVVGNSSFVLESCKIDNRNGVANPSPIRGIYVYDLSGATSVGKINDNIIDGSNDSSDSVNELYVFSNGAFIVITNNVLSDLTQSVFAPKTNFGGSNAISKIDNTAFNSSGILADI